jgi:hypothetical protein
MKTLITVLITLTALYSFAQENSDSEIQKFQIGVNFSPDVCYRTLKLTDEGATYFNSVVNPEWIVDYRNDLEIIKLGYSAGVHVNYNLNRKFGIQAGLEFANKGYQTKKVDLIYPQPNKPAPSFPNQAKNVFNYMYLDIPIRVNLTLGSKKIRFISSLGITTNVFLFESVKSVKYYSDRTERDTQVGTLTYNRINISPTASIGIDYKINSRMNLRVEPTIRYGLLQIIDAPITAHLFNGGVNMSCFFSL